MGRAWVCVSLNAMKDTSSQHVLLMSLSYLCSLSVSSHLNNWWHTRLNTSWNHIWS